MYNYCSVSLARQLESGIWNLAAELKKHLFGKRGEVRLNTWHWNKYNSVLVAQKEWFMARVEDRRWEIQYTAFSSRCKSVYTENNHCSKWANTWSSFLGNLIYCQQDTSSSWILPDFLHMLLFANCLLLLVQRTFTTPPLLYG